MDPSLEKFGAFIVRNLRDTMLDLLGRLLKGESNAPTLHVLQKRVVGLSVDDKQMLRDLIEELTTAGMHDLLFGLQEEADTDGEIRVFVDGKEIAKLSDGLHGEIFGDDGWIVRYSRFPSEAQIELSRWAEEQIRKMTGGESKVEE